MGFFDVSNFRLQRNFLMKQQQKKKNYVKSPIVGIKLRIDAIKKQIPNLI